MAKYRVKPGYTYGAYGTFREGDIVELPEKDAGPFLDKLELVPGDVPDAPPDDAVIPSEPESLPLSDIESDETPTEVSEELVVEVAPKKTRPRKVG